MYPVSSYEMMKEAILEDLVECKWYGTITTTSGMTRKFTMNDIVEGSCSIARSISSDGSLDIGTAYASELKIEFYLDVDRYILHGAKINLWCKYAYRRPIETWEELAPFSWNDISDSPWNDIKPSFKFEIGNFVIAETQRTIEKISVTAYDYMLNFDSVAINDLTTGSSNTKLAITGKEKRTPYQWLATLCSSAKISLGSTQTDIASLPNGNFQFYCDMSSIEGGTTARSMLMYLCSAICGFAYIGRDGKLYVDKYHILPDDTLKAGERYESELSDFIVYYTGLRSTYVAESEIEYYKNTSMTGKDDGLVVDLGVNPFLQITSSSQRKQVLQNIINSLAMIQYVPYSGSIPCNPAYDPGDVINFQDNQASSRDYGAITDMTYRLNGKMDLKSSGENPEYVAATGIRSNGTYTGGAGSGANSEGPWIETSPKTDVSMVESEMIEMNAVSHQNGQATDQKTGIQYMASYYKDVTGEVVAEVYFNDDLIATFKDVQDPGNRTFPINMAYNFSTAGNNTISVHLGGE